MCWCSELERIADAEVKRLQSLVVMQQIISHQHNLCFDLVSHNTPHHSQAGRLPQRGYSHPTTRISHLQCIAAHCVRQCLKEFSSPSLASAESRCLTACFHRYEDARQAAINTLKDKMQSAKR